MGGMYHCSIRPRTKESYDSTRGMLPSASCSLN